MKFILIGLLAWGAMFFGGFFVAIHIDTGYGLVMVFTSIFVVAGLGLGGGALFTRKTIFEAQKLNDQYDVIKMKALAEYGGKVHNQAMLMARNSQPPAEEVIDGDWSDVFDGDDIQLLTLGDKNNVQADDESGW